MNLPVAAKRKAEEAARLMREGNAPAETAAPGTGTPQDTALKEAHDRLVADNTRLTQANKVLQEKYNAEVPRMAAEIKELKETVKKLEEAARKRFEAGEISSLTDDERAMLGQDTIKAMSKLSREVMSGMMDEHLKPLRDSIDMFKRQSDAQYDATLDREVQDWVKINEDPKFLAWLNGLDPATATLRNELLQSAHALRQGFRVAEIFKAFKESREIGAPPTPKPSPSPAAGTGETPRASGSEKKTYSREQIKQHFRDKIAGKWKGREAEARALEADFQLATLEGRVT
jgi:hypothetical protein